VLCKWHQEEVHARLAIVPNAWPVKIGTDLSRHEVLVLRSSLSLA
jgi:hypothetical protein